MRINTQALYLFIIAVPNIVLALFILIRNTKDNINRHFSAFAVGVTIWSLGLGAYIATDSLTAARHWAQLYYIAAASIATSFVLFSQYFSPQKIVIKKQVYITAVLPFLILTSVTIVTPGWLIVDVVQRSWGKEVILNTTGYMVYSIYFAAFVLYGFGTILRNMLLSVGQFKVYLKFVFAGLIIAFGLGMVFNLIYPALGNYRYIWIGPQFTLFYVGVLAYTIVKHKLFDIKAAATRAVVYLLAMLFVGLLYMTIIMSIGTYFVGIRNINNTQRLFFVVLSLVSAVAYNPIKFFFNRLTTKLFYRDAYETQGVLDKVSGVIVGTVDHHKVQKGALSALSEALRPTYMIFLLSNDSGRLQKGDLVGQQWNMRDPDVLQEALRRNGKKIILFDELEEQSGGLRDVLRVEDISVVAPLVTKDETIGYLVLGPKKSGNIYSSQDIGLLNIASNELAVALQNAQRFEEIQAFNITLQEKVNEATRELKKTNRKLVALDEAKDEFISMASHQLRTPLTSIKGYLSMLAEGDLGKVSKAQEKAIKEAFGSSQRMVYLIADFLNVSRIRTGKFVIEPKEVDLPQMVGDEITQLKELAASRDITIKYQAPEAFPKVMLDDNKIRQVMMNIVDNAIYYTAAGGTVTIQLFVDSADVVFKVIDTGIGVPKREQHKLFTKFFRAGNARKARPDGTGLGLFMAQKIIAEQGGSIIFESTEGKGSTFGFRFPLSKIKT